MVAARGTGAAGRYPTRCGSSATWWRQGPARGHRHGPRDETADAAYVTACDAPFLQHAVVELLFERLGARDVSVVEAEGRLAAPHGRVPAPGAGRGPRARGGRPPPPGRPLRARRTVRVSEAELRAVDPELRYARGLQHAGGLRGGPGHASRRGRGHGRVLRRGPPAGRRRRVHGSRRRRSARRCRRPSARHPPLSPRVIVEGPARAPLARRT